MARKSKKTPFAAFDRKMAKLFNRKPVTVTIVRADGTVEDKIADRSDGFVCTYATRELIQTDSRGEYRVIARKVG